jgi:hypothetical protein
MFRPGQAVLVLSHESAGTLRCPRDLPHAASFTSSTG